MANDRREYFREYRRRRYHDDEEFREHCLEMSRHARARRLAFETPELRRERLYREKVRQQAAREARERGVPRETIRAEWRV
jgi:hypothetical protein